MAHKPNSARGDWAKQLRFDMMFAEKTLLKGGEVRTMFVVHAKGEKHVIAAPWRDDEEKAALLDMIRAYCIAHDAEAVPTSARPGSDTSSRRQARAICSIRRGSTRCVCAMRTTVARSSWL